MTCGCAVWRRVDLCTDTRPLGHADEICLADPRKAVPGSSPTEEPAETTGKDISKGQSNPIGPSTGSSVGERGAEPRRYIVHGYGDSAIGCPSLYWDVRAWTAADAVTMVKVDAPQVRIINVWCQWPQSVQAHERTAAVLGR